MSMVSIGNVRTSLLGLHCYVFERAIVKQNQGRNITQPAIIRDRNYRED